MINGLLDPGVICIHHGASSNSNTLLLYENKINITASEDKY